MSALTRISGARGRNLLRFLTCGSVDDGKSTLIGRLLIDTHSVYDDEFEDSLESEAVILLARADRAEDLRCGHGSGERGGEQDPKTRLMCGP